MKKSLLKLALAALTALTVLTPLLRPLRQVTCWLRPKLQQQNPVQILTLVLLQLRQLQQSLKTYIESLTGVHVRSTDILVENMNATPAGGVSRVE